MKVSVIELFSALVNTKNSLAHLEETHTKKFKGASYIRARQTLESKINYLFREIENLGTKGNIFRLTFQYREFNQLYKGQMYLSNLEEHSILPIITNLKKYQHILPDTLKVTEIKLGAVEKKL